MRMESSKLWTVQMDTPLGVMTGLIEGNGFICELGFGEINHPSSPERPPKEVSTTRLYLGRQLFDYFHGRLRNFNLPLQPQGSVYQQKIWSLMREVKYGFTMSYKTLAEAAGDPLGSRAVGTASAANPIMILIPCHRIIGSDRALVGYRYGLDKKTKLLQLEGSIPKSQEVLTQPLPGID